MPFGIMDQPSSTSMQSASTSEQSQRSSSGGGLMPGMEQMFNSVIKSMPRLSNLMQSAAHTLDAVQSNQTGGAGVGAERQDGPIPAKDFMVGLSMRPGGASLLKGLAASPTGPKLLDALVETRKGQEALLDMADQVVQMQEQQKDGGGRQAGSASGGGNSGASNGSSEAGAPNGEIGSTGASAPEAESGSSNTESAPASGGADSSEVANADPQEFLTELTKMPAGKAIVETLAESEDGQKFLEALVDFGEGKVALMALIEGLETEADGEAVPAEQFIEVIKKSEPATALISALQKAGEEGEALASKIIKSAEGQAGLAGFAKALSQT